MLTREIEEVKHFEPQQTYIANFAKPQALLSLLRAIKAYPLKPQVSPVTMKEINKTDRQRSTEPFTPRVSDDPIVAFYAMRSVAHDNDCVVNRVRIACRIVKDSSAIIEEAICRVNCTCNWPHKRNQLPQAFFVVVKLNFANFLDFINWREGISLTGSILACVFVRRPAGYSVVTDVLQSIEGPTAVASKVC